MIVTKISGGLGNQMFQYAAGRALAEKHGVETQLDLSWYEKEYGAETTRRTCELDVFSFEKHLYNSNTLMRRMIRTIAPDKRTYHEKSLAYNPDLLHLPDKTVLDGYFPTERYFEDIAETIRKDFSWAKKATKPVLRFVDQIKQDSHAVSIHVRRSDYIKNASVNQVHGALTLDYYRRAAQHIGRKVKQPHFYVFSDDIDWCREHLTFLKQATFSPNTQGADDMRSMQECRHHIIANSTFSWWGAWLAEQPGQVVIGPQQWFASSDLDSRDIIPSRWLSI